MDRRALILAAWRVNRTFPVLIGVLLLANFAVFAFLSLRVSPELDEMERRYIARQATLRQGRQGEAQSPAAVFRRGQDDLKKFREVLPEKADFTALIGEIYALAGAESLSIDRISYAPKEIPEEGLQRYALSFSVHGDYAQIKRFIFAIEQSRRMLSVENISLAGGQSDRPGVDLKLQLVTYFRTGQP